jgi:hypothetical protein
MNVVLIAAIFGCFIAMHCCSFRLNRNNLEYKVKEKTSLKSFTNAFLTAVIDNAKPEGYVYGEVSAPGWVLPVASVLVILTAAIPILLKPGEEALDQQRENEEKVNSQFNRRQNKDLR